MRYGDNGEILHVPLRGSDFRERHFKLVPRHDVALWSPGGVLGKFELDGEHVLGAGLRARLLDAEVDFLRGEGREVAKGNITGFNLLSVLLEDPRAVHEGKIAEVELVLHAHLAAEEVDGFCLDVGIGLLYFRQARVRRTVGRTKPLVLKLSSLGLSPKSPP